ncbi:MAG: flagellar basal body P-ring formation chaperone FlgA [Pseudomonadales bacterium]|nr:flagellar basal body P-ring formation chaperone FlgA [Pseudomonadales bacterium]
MFDAGTLEIPRPWTTLILANVLLLLSLPLPTPAQAQAADLMQDQRAVVAAVESFLSQQVTEPETQVAIVVHPPYALLPACSAPSPFLPQATGRKLLGRVVVGVRCEGDDQPRRYLQAEISIIGTYLELARNLEPDTRLTRDMLTLAQGDLSQLPPRAIRSTGAAVGQLTRHGLTAGTILQAQHLYQVPLVERGQKITIEARGRGFSMSRAGEALDAGALGEKIRVRLSPRETLDTIVTGRGQVVPEY